MVPVEKEKQTPHVSLGELMKEHLEASSAPGLPNIHRSKTLVGKAFWVTLILFGFIVVCFQVTRLYYEFKSHPIRVNMRYEYNRTLRFPAVTICNLNPIRESMLGRSDSVDLQWVNQPSLQDPGNDQLKPPKPPPPPPPQPLSSQSLTTEPTSTEAEFSSSVFKTVNLQPRTEDRKSAPPKCNPGECEPTKKLNNTNSLKFSLFNKSEEEKRAMGHQLEDMLLECSWKGTACSHTDFIQHFNAIYGNCYTFNSGSNFSEVLSTTKPGPSYGLRLELYLEQDEYMTNVTETAGMRIILHNQYVMPFPDEEGFNIPPGKLTAAGFTMKSITRLPHPYGECYQEGDSDVPNFFQEPYGVDYSLKVCERSCYQSWLVMTCDCIDPNYPYPSYVNESENTRPCDVIGGKYPGDPDCLKRADELFVNNQLDHCGCTQPCREREFMVSVSSSSWPANKYDDEILGKISGVDTFANKQPPHNLREWLMNNVARCDIYFEQLNYEDIKEEPAYTEKNLMSDIGGQLGLWIGISLITMFEFFQLFGTVVSYIWKAVFSSFQKKNKHLLSKVTFKLLRQSTGSENKVFPNGTKEGTGVTLTSVKNKDSDA